MDYELEFLPKNQIPDNAMIKIEFDVAFSLNYATPANQYVYIEYGLEDISEEEPVLINIVSDYIIQITSFRGMTNPNKIKIHFRVKNPSTATTSNPIKIRTYTDATSNVIIDKDIT